VHNAITIATRRARRVSQSTSSPASTAYRSRRFQI
jgi:hypothetical protein